MAKPPLLIEEFGIDSRQGDNWTRSTLMALFTFRRHKNDKFEIENYKNILTN